jgi:hypothetical protein
MEVVFLSLVLQHMYCVMIMKTIMNAGIINGK